MWPFRNRNEDAQTIRALRAEVEEAWDSYTIQIQHTGTAKAALALVQKPMTEAGLDEIARSVAAEIADIYACGGSSVRLRDIAVRTVIRAAVRKATTGEKAWNEAMLARAAYEREA